MTKDEHTPVLIAGGGLAGLSMSMLLSEHGISNTLVEKRSGTSTHPRARGVNVRTMEILRALGLEDRVRGTESARALAGNSGIIAMQSLTGRLLGELGNAYLTDPDPAAWSEVSPTAWALCDQDELEPLIEQRARAKGARLYFETELAELHYEGDREVSAVVRDLRAGTERRITADYLVAADGAHSPIRERLDIPMEGPGTLAHFCNVYFHADLAEALGDRRFIMCYVMQDDFRGALLPIDNNRRWLLHVPFDPGKGTVAEQFGPDECTELVRTATGISDLEVDVRGALAWESAGRTAQRWRQGPVFLVGDAAHVMPPSGAFGSNTGIQDAHNLAWKLAAVLRGEAGPGLLDSYAQERRPVSLFTVDQAVLRSKDRPRVTGGPGADGEIVPDADVMLGFRYRSDAVLPDGSDDEGGPWAPVAEPGGASGLRAAHIPLDGSGSASLIDVFGTEFVLVTGVDGQEWERAAAAAAGRGARLRAFRLPDDRASGAAELFRQRYGVKDDGAVLVRPDGFIGWRCVSGVGEPHAVLADAIARLTYRNTGQVAADDR